MPPDPILALLSFVGLCGYAVLGGVFGTLFVRLCSKEKYLEAIKSRQYTGKIGDYYHSSTYASEGWAIFVVGAVLWPAMVPLGVCAVALYGPIWLSTRIGSYVAKAQLETGD